jgi:putative glutathione S-transferase
MGMLINGTWCDEDRIWQDGAYRRAPSRFQGATTPDIVAALGETPERFCLIASDSCPWSHRVRLVLAIKGDDRLPVHLAHGPRLQGYAIAGGAPWRIPGTTETIHHLHQLYSHGDPCHTGRVTVPVLWDAQERRIVSNESADVVAALDAAIGDVTLAPPDLAEAMARLDGWLYDSLANGVYRAGFARSQAAFDAAARGVFDALDWLNGHLRRSRCLHGTILTLSDLRLLPTLVRFDLVYHFQFGCSRRRLRDLDALWAYARDLYAAPRVRRTVDFPTIVQASYHNDGGRTPPLVPALPDIPWDAPHDRDALGPLCVMTRRGDAIPLR